MKHSPLLYLKYDLKICKQRLYYNSVGKESFYANDASAGGMWNLIGIVISDTFGNTIPLFR